MFNGKRKAVTFSYDDGITQDIRLIEILDKYGLKCTFNLNSGTLGQKGTLDRNNRIVDFNRIKKQDVAKVYKNHEVAVHTIQHLDLTKLTDTQIINEVEDDRLTLSELSGQNVIGMAYPFGKADRRVADVIKNNTGVKYSRTVFSTNSFEPQTDLLLFNPTVHEIKENDLFALAEKFLSDTSQNPLLFYIWGHSFEFDAYNSWERFEEFCKLISGKDDVFYGTNKEVLL